MHRRPHIPSRVPVTRPAPRVVVRPVPRKQPQPRRAR